MPKVYDEEEYRIAIDEIIAKHKITHILPLTDVEVDYYNNNRKHYEDMNVVICISSYETIEICRNKKKQQEFIDSNVNGIKTIPTKTIKEIKENPYDFPMVAKLTNGRSSQGLKYIENQEELNLILNTNNENYIFQPKIEGNIITVDVICDGINCVAIPREELLRTLNGAGLSVKVFSDRILEDSCKKLALALGIRGCVNFEFIRDSKGEYNYIECNPRFSGGVEFSNIAGYDCVLNHIKCFTEEKENIDDFQLNKTIYIARKYEEYVMKTIE